MKVLNVPSRGVVDGVVLTALALAIRLVCAFRVEVIFNDGPRFLRIAEHIRAGDWGAALADEYHPLYSALVAAAQVGLPDAEAAGMLVSLVAGVATVPIVFAWLREALGPAHGRIGAFLVAVHPYAIEVSTNVLSDGVHLALLAGAMALLWRALRDRRDALALTGAFVGGLAYLTRPEGAGVILVAGGLGLWELARRRWEVGRAARWLGALCLGAALGTVPYAASLSVQRGEITFSQKKSINVLIGVEALRGWLGARSEPTTPAAVGAPVRREPNPFVSSAPQRGWQRYPAALLEVIQTWMATARYEIVALALLGVSVIARRSALLGRYVATLLGFYVLLLWGLLAHVGYLSHRHALPLVLATLAYASAGVPVLVDALARWIPSRRASLALVALLVGVLGVGKALRTPGGDAAAERRLAEWLRETRAPASPVAAVKHRVAFYARAPFVDLRLAPGGEDLLDHLRNLGVAYLIVDEDENAILRRIEGAPAALELLRRAEVRNEAAFLYELHGKS